MKKIFTLFTIILAWSTSSLAQSFTSQYDTVYQTVSGSYTIHNNIHNLTTSPDTLQWQLISENWPADWDTTLGLCDAFTCYTHADMWPPGRIKECGYNPSAWGDFHILGDLTAVSSPGPYVLRLRFNNKFIPTDTFIQTYIIAKPTSVFKVTGQLETTLYPNPATNMLNVTFADGLDVKNIAIQSIIGRQVKMFSVSDNKGAGLNIEDIPGGIYFLKLLNGYGNVVATFRFTKQ